MNNVLEPVYDVFSLGIIQELVFVVGVGNKDYADLCGIAHCDVILSLIFDHINKTKMRKNATRGPFERILWGVPSG